MNDVWKCPWCGGEMTEAHPMCADASRAQAEEIEELEVKLAHAMEALKIDPWFIGYSGWKKYVKDTLADLKGQGDE